MVMVMAHHSFSIYRRERLGMLKKSCENFSSGGGGGVTIMDVGGKTVASMIHRRRWHGGTYPPVRWKL